MDDAWRWYFQFNRKHEIFLKKPCSLTGKNRDFPSMYPFDHGNKQALKGRESVFEFLEVRNVAEEVVLRWKSDPFCFWWDLSLFFVPTFYSWISQGRGYYRIMSVLCVLASFRAGNKGCVCAPDLSLVHPYDFSIGWSMDLRGKGLGGWLDFL